MGRQFICKVLLQLKRLGSPVSFISEKPPVQSKMIKAIEIELQTKNFRLDQGGREKPQTSTELKGLTIKTSKSPFFKGWKIQHASL